MLLVSIIIFAIILGLLRGDKLSNLISLEVNHIWIAFLPAIIKYLLSLLIQKEIISSKIIVFAIIILQYLLLFIFLWLNKRIPYIWLVTIGTFLNALVIALNRGSMPLSKHILNFQSSESLRLLIEDRLLIYHIVNENTKLRFLGDIIFIPKPFMNYLSIGDIILYLGVFLIIQSTIAKNKIN